VVEIFGTSGLEGFRAAEISFAYQNDPTATWFLIQQTSQPVVDGLLARWDTSTITDGQYRLRLQVFFQDGQVMEQVIGGLRVRATISMHTSARVTPDGEFISGPPLGFILYPDPGFPIYRSMIEFTGARPVPIPILEKNGFAFGSIYSDGTILNPKVSADLAVIGSFARIAGRQPNGTPNSTTNPYAYGFVTDGFIGWEVNAGVDWKLLENLTATVRWAYWQPGEFFKEAYQARLPSANGGLPPVDTDTGKEIGQVLTHRDAIQAMQTSLIVSF
jgi:hypothetical protein